MAPSAQRAEATIPRPLVIELDVRDDPEKRETPRHPANPTYMQQGEARQPRDVRGRHQ